MSYRTVCDPADEEHEELKRMKRQEVGRVAMRAHMVFAHMRATAQLREKSVYGL